MRKRLETFKKDQKGFTLVELIVVLVILAILAALLVPALLGYIDRAKNSKYLEEARSVYTAIQAVNDEKYAKAGTGHVPVNLADKDDFKKINLLITPTKITTGDGDAATALNSSGTIVYGDEDEHAKFTVKELKELKFISQDTTKVKVTMNADGSWDTENMKLGDEAWK